MNLIELFSALVITFVLGGLVSSLVDDFVLTIKFDKKMLMNIINSLMFMYISGWMEIRHNINNINESV